MAQKIRIVSQVLLSFLIIAIFIFILQKSMILVTIVVIITNLFIFVLESLLKKYLTNQKRKALELALIDEVLLLSSQPKANDLKQILTKLSSSKHRIVKTEFTQLLKKTENGHSIRELFFVLSKKYNSEILDRFLELLQNTITTGTVSITDYRSFASNFIKSKQLIEERKSALLMQKYTIIFAGGLIVPGILGIVIKLVKKLTSSLDFSILQSFQAQASNPALFNICYVCSIIYLLEYVIISSIYLGLLESDIKKAIVYVVFMQPIAIAIFFLGPLVI